MYFKMKHIYLTLALAGLALSCVRCGSDAESTVSEDRATTITIDMDRSVEQMDCAFLFDTTRCEIIPLETSDECLIGEVSKIFSENGRICILDKKANSVFILEEDGRLTAKIFAVGRSDREYLKLADMSVSDGLIWLLDQAMNKILCYDLSGQYLKTIDISSYWANKILVRNDRIYLINEWSDSDEGMYRLFVLDTDGKPIDKFLPFETEDTDRYCGRNLESYTILGDEIDLCYPSDNTVYGVADGKCTAKYRIDFGKRTMPEEHAAKSLIEYMNNGLNEEYVMGIDAFKESSRYLFFRFGLGATDYTAIYDKKTGTVDLTNSASLINNSTCCLSLTSYFVEGDDVYSYIPAYQLKLIYAYGTKNKLPEGNVYGDRLSQIIADTDESDNGILVKYKLNE